MMITCASVCAFSAADAQIKSDPTRLIIGAGLAGMSISSDFDGQASTTEGGVGFHLEAGWGFRRPIVVSGRFSRVLIESDVNYTADQIDLSARYLFLSNAQAFRPYLELGIARRTINQLNVIIEDVQPTSATSSSTGVLGGIGVHMFVNPRLVLDGGITVAPGSFSDWSSFGQPVPVGTINAVSVGVRLGVRAWILDR